MNNSIILPLLPVSILYEIPMVFPPACICSFAVIKDHFFLDELSQYLLSPSFSCQLPVPPQLTACVQLYLFYSGTPS